jgi:hypothetical protein
MEYCFNDGGRAADYGRTRRGSDCVARSIAIASGQSYMATLIALCDLAVEIGAMPNDKWLYEKYLEKIGFTKRGTPRDERNRKIRLCDWQFRNGRAVVNVSGHLTAVIDGVVQDTWDCRRKCCNTIWEG